MKKIAILSGTRAEFGKLKPLIKILDEDSQYDTHLFVTGMHLLEKYGGTAREVLSEFSNIYLYNNQAFGSRLDIVLANTIYGFSHYINEVKPDLIIVHGDRAETLAGAITGSFNNILVAHIEGGEVSGAIDELIRHSVSKLAHVHFVANKEAKKRLIQMGELEGNIYIIGSPDIDIMNSDSLPALEDVLKHYAIPFKEYAILLYHPVTTEIEKMPNRVKMLVDTVIYSGINYVVIYPNNDPGSEIILDEYERLRGLPNFRLYPSIRFESFLTLLKNCRFIIGNSSAGIREAPVYGIPTINLGTRQENRHFHKSIFNLDEDEWFSLNCAIEHIIDTCPRYESSNFFGKGDSVVQFKKILDQGEIWGIKIQKQFNEKKT